MVDLTPVADPPHDRDAEEAVVGSLLQAGRAALGEIGDLTSADFFVIHLGILFSAIVALVARDSAVDTLTVSALLQETGEFERIGGANELVRLSERVPSAANVSYHAAIVRKRARARRFLETARRLSDQVARLAFVPDGSEQALREALAAAAPTSPSNEFKFLNFDEIVANGIPPLEWLLPNWLVRGDIALLAGPAYCGKTTLAAALLIAFASGRPWCGIAPTTVDDVLCFDEEQGEALTARLFLRLGARGMARLRVASGQGVNVATADGFARLEREIAKTRPLVVMLDSASQCFAGIDENSAEEVAPVFARLFRLRDRYRVAFVILHHLKKPPSDGRIDLLTSVRGSTAWATQASTVWVAQKVDDATLDLIQAKRRGTAPTSLRITYSEEYSDGPITLTGGARPDAEKTKAANETRDADLRQRILGALAGAAPALLTRDEVHEKVSGRAAAINAAIAAMFEAGELERQGMGRSGNPHRFGVRVPVQVHDSRFPTKGGGIAEWTGDCASIPDSRNGSESRNGGVPDDAVRSLRRHVDQDVGAAGSDDDEPLPWDRDSGGTGDAK